MSWFANLTETAPLSTPVDMPDENGASAEVTIYRPANEQVRVLGAATSKYFRLEFNSANSMDVTKYSNTTRAYGFGGGDGKPRTVKFISDTNPETGNPGYGFISDGKSIKWSDAEGGENGFWTINALLSSTSSFAEGGFSRGTVRDGAGGVIVDWYADYVINAAGDGWVLRTDANNDPSIAEAGFDRKIYDYSSLSGNHVDLPASTTWDFISGFIVPEQVLAGSNGNSFEVPPGFNVDRFDFSGIEIPFTFDSSAGTGTFDPPSMGNVANFAPFGETTITIYDDTAGTFATTKVDWSPPAPYEYSKFAADPDTANVGNAYYQWPDPPVATNLAVYDTTYYSISDGRNDDGDLTGNDGILKINPDAPAQFAVNEYIIDTNGMQEFTRSSGTSGVVLPTATINTPAQSIVSGESLQLSTNITNADTISWTTSGDGTFSDDSIDQPVYTGGTPASDTLTVTATNADGSVSDSVTITVEAAAQSTLNLTVAGIPDGAQSVKLWSESDNGLLYEGNVTFSSEAGSVTLSASAGTVVTGRWLGDNPPETGTGLYGVTE